MDMRLHHRVVLVTGGASGIGLACVQAATLEGAKVLILDRNKQGQKVADDLCSAGHTAAFVETDLTVESDVIKAIKLGRDQLGQIDSVIACAGISGPVGQTIPEVSADEWDRVMAVNVKANFLIAKHSIPHLQNSDVATIVFLASDSALVGFEGMAPYCTSKGAVLMLTKSLSVDHKGIRVNCLCPGVVDTPMSRADLGRPEGFEGTGLPIMHASQIAQHAIFLASPISAPINGTSLLADFGYLARSALPPLEFSDHKKTISRSNPTPVSHRGDL